MKSKNCLARTLLSESAATKMARKHLDVRFTSRDLKVLCEAYNTIPMHESLIKVYRLNKLEKMALLLVSEQVGVSPEELLLQEGVWDSIKKLGKGIGAAVASPFKAVAKAKKGHDKGASAWQSVKYGMTALPQLFKHGTHFGQGKASEKAIASYQKILSDFENHSNQQLKDLTKAAKQLGDDFPNNAKPESFRMMLMGKEKFADIEAEGLGGLVGAMLDIRNTQQDFVDQGGDIKVANQIIGRMRKMLQFYMGELHDTYQSLENRDRHGLPLVRSSTSVALMDLYYDNDYWYRQVSEGIIVETPTEIVEDPNQAKELEQAVQDKSEKEIAGMFSDEGLEGLSNKQLDSMKAASSALRPLLIACLGAAMTALGVSQGGSMIGDFENSEAFTKMLKSLEGIKIIELPAKVSEQVTAVLTDVSVNPGEGLTQFVGRIGGASANQIQGMSGSEFVAFAKENGITAESMKGLLGNSGQAFESLGSMEGTIGELGSQIGNGKIPADPFNMSLGDTSIKKKIASSVFKAARNYTVKSFAAGAVGKASIGAALPTILATAGVGVAASGVAIAALRKFAKNRKKTLMAAIELLKDIEGISPDAPAADPGNVGDGAPIEEPDEPLEVQSRADELPLDLFKDTLKDKGYDKPDELADEMFKDKQVEDALVQDSYRRELNLMTEEIARWNQLAGLNEDATFDDFTGMVQRVSKDAELPGPDKEQLGFGAQALNVTKGVGNVTDLPGQFAKEEFEARIDELENSIGKMKLDNNKAVREMLDKLATKSGLDPSSFKDKENSDYLAAIGETIDLDAQDIDNLHGTIEDLNSSLATAKADLDAKEGELAAETAKLKAALDKNMDLLGDNKELNQQVKALMNNLTKNDIEITDLKGQVAQAEEIKALDDKTIKDLNGQLQAANDEIAKLQAREEELNNRLIDLRKLWIAMSKIQGGKETTFKTQAGGPEREKTYDNIAKTFIDMGDEYPALKDTGEIIKRSREEGVLSSYADEWEEDPDKESKKRRKQTPRKKKEKSSDESSWKKGDLIMEKLDSLINYIQEGSEWYDDKHETLADRKYSDALDAEEAQPSQEETDGMFDQISDEIEEMGSSVAEQGIADMWMDENEYLYRGIYVDTRPHQGGKVKIIWPGWDDARYRGDLGW